MNRTYIRYELLRTFRNRRFFVFSLGFPLVLYGESSRTRARVMDKLAAEDVALAQQGAQADHEAAQAHEAEESVQRRLASVVLERASLSIQQGHWEVDQRTGVHRCSKPYLSLLGLPENSDACSTLAAKNGR